MLRIYGPLIELDDVALVNDQEGAWKAEVTVPVKQVPIENVVNSRHLIRSAKGGECQAALSRQRQNFFGAVRITLAKAIQVHGEQLRALPCPPRVERVENRQVFLATRRPTTPRLKHPGFA